MGGEFQCNSCFKPLASATVILSAVESALRADISNLSGLGRHFCLACQRRLDADYARILRELQHELLRDNLRLQLRVFYAMAGCPAGYDAIRVVFR